MSLEHGEPSSQKTPENSLILSSRRIQAFLGNVKTGDYFAFVDSDQTITKKGIDTEDLALGAGIWPPENRGQNEESLLPSLAIDTQAVGAPALEALRDSLSKYTPYVTEELSAITGIPVGTVMSSDVLKSVGRHVGRKLIEKNLLRENAIDVIKTLQEENVRVVVLTATPVEIAEGVYEELGSKYNLLPITILGTELAFDSQGHAEVELHMFGPPKLSVVEAAKGKGGIALFGIGDKPLTSDAFMWQCENPIPINDKEYGEFGNKAWRNLVEICRNNV